MRLTVLGPGHPFRGGIALTTTALVNALEKRGHTVTFLTPLRQYPRLLFPGGDDRDPEACRELGCASAVLDPMNPLSWRRSRRRALETEADAWIVPYWTWAWAGLWRYLLRSRSRPPAVAVVHNPADHGARAVHRLAARSVLRRCAALFTHAESLAALLRRDYPGVPVACHALGVEPPTRLPERGEARTRLGLPPAARVALFIGFLRPYKGADVLVEACAHLAPESDWHLVVAGEPWGDTGRRLRRQVSELGVCDRVRLDLRFIPESEVSVFLGSADVVVLPYRSGSQSAVAPLALSHGLPVLSTTVGGLPEVVSHGDNGLLVEPGSVPALACALESLDRATLAHLAEGARTSAGALSWSSYAEALEGLLSITCRSGAPSR